MKLKWGHIPFQGREGVMQWSRIPYSREDQNLIESRALTMGTKEDLKAKLLDAFNEMQQEGHDLDDFEKYLVTLVERAREEERTNGHFEHF